MGKWGSLNSGEWFGVLAVDVDRALAAANLNKYEQRLMQYIREHSWGTTTRRKGPGAWPDAKACPLSLADLAKAMGVPLPRLSAAKATLLKSKMIAKSGDKWTVNKNANQWLMADGKTPRLTPKDLEYAIAGRRSADQKTADQAAENTHDASTGVGYQIEQQQVTENCKSHDSHRQSSVTENCNPRLQKTVSEVTENCNQAHYITRASEESGREEREKTPPTPPGGAACVAESSEPNTDPLNVGGILTPDPADLDRLTAWCDATFGALSEVASRARAFSASYPLGWMRQALEIAASKPNLGDSWIYAHKILQRWDREGGPPKHVQTKAIKASEIVQPTYFVDSMAHLRTDREFRR